MSDEGATQADWGGQVAAEELSEVGQARQLAMPDWANLETPPVPEVGEARANLDRWRPAWRRFRCGGPRGRAATCCCAM